MVQEASPPYPVVLRVVDGKSEMMKIGRAMLRKAIETWADCLEADRWPGYELTGTLQMPSWQENLWSVRYAPWMKTTQPTEIAP